MLTSVNTSDMSEFQYIKMDDKDFCSIDSQNDFTMSIDDIEPQENEDYNERFYKKLEEKELLTQEEVIELFKTIEANGPDAKAAKEKLFERNMRLVMFIANRYKYFNTPLEDLVQEGSIGLLTAIDRFDYTMGYHFSTYATHWIRQAIQRYLHNTDRMIRLPVHLSEKYNKIYGTEKKLTVLLGRKPTAEEIADELNLPIRIIYDAMKHQKTIFSYNKMVSDSSNTEDDTELVDFIVDDKANENDPEEATTYKLLCETFDKIMNKCLSEKEKEIIIRRYGLHGHETETLEEIAKDFHLTRERIRQIQRKAEDKLSTNKNKERLKDFLY